MKILVTSIYYYPEIGAAPSRITNLVEALQAKGNQVDVLTSLPNYPKGKLFDGYRNCLYMSETISNCHVYRYWMYATVSKKPLLRAWSILSFALMIWGFAFHFRRIRRYDRIIIQCPPLPVATSAMLIFKCLYQRTTIINVSDLWPLSAVELGAMRKNSLPYKLFAWMERFVYKKADGIMAQSNESIRHISMFSEQTPKFLYRNLQKYKTAVGKRRSKGNLKVVYAGLLGVAQNLLEIMQVIDFKNIGVELHLYGGGNQANVIKQYIDTHNTNVFYHGVASKSEMENILSSYDASLIPLTVHIKGAVPSKLFDIIPLGIPVLFCGGGEGAEIVRNYQLGYVSEPRDYLSLEENLIKLSKMPPEQYISLTENCCHVAQEHFNFDEQMTRFTSFLNKFN